jgi:hypothetical protein
MNSLLQSNVRAPDCPLMGEARHGVADRAYPGRFAPVIGAVAHENSFFG